MSECQPLCVRTLAIEMWLDARPRWFAPWHMRTIWRRGSADYLYLWPDGLFRRERPQSYRAEHIERNVACWRILDAVDHMPPGMTFARFTDTKGTLGRIASRGVRGPWWLT